VNIKLISALAATAVLSAAPAFAAPVTFDFETATLGAPIGDVHAAGVDFSFSADLLGVVNDEFSQFFTGAPSPIGVLNPVGPANALNVVSGAMSLAQAVTFSYSATEVSSVSVWSGLNGTGTQLGTISLAANSSGCGEATPYCIFQSATLAFSGFAKSITFDTPYFAAFDNVEVNAVPVPAAGWLMMSALAGFGAWRRKRAAV
jgi:hypothetical protein